MEGIDILTFHRATDPWKSTVGWLDDRRACSGVDASLWRVHDKLYDLTPFIEKVSLRINE
jgi:hypothetical protein